MNLTTIGIGIVIMAFILFAYYGITWWLSLDRTKKEPVASTVDVKELVDALGGADNILLSEASHSKLIVDLKDTKLIKPDVIQALGASGIVENQRSISMIFGKMSEAIDKDVRDYCHL